MTEKLSFIDIKPGQWVLAFNEPYGPHRKPMSEHLEMFVHRGGGWESDRPDEILHVYRVLKVSLRVYEIDPVISGSLTSDVNVRQRRQLVIAAGESMADMIALRNKFFGIGVDTEKRIEAEMYRRIQKFAEREEAKALKKIHQCLPHIFGGAA